MIFVPGFLQTLGAQRVIIHSPRGGFTTDRVQKISGTIENYKASRATLVLNGIPQGIAINNGRFSVEVIVSPGSNLVEVIAGRSKDRVAFYAKVSPRDIKVVLTWDTPTDVDLWVIDPTGEKCYYSNRSTASGGNLDVDIISGFGPETYTMAKALPGQFSVQVQYYSSGNAPITRVNVFVVLYEGTPREKRMKFEFVMTQANQVYHIAQFNVEAGEP